MDNVATGLLIVGATAATAAVVHDLYSRSRESRRNPDAIGSGSANPFAPVPLSARIAGAASSAVGGLLSNSGTLPTAAQKAEWIRVRRRALPNVIVARVRIPQGVNIRNLSEAGMQAAGCGAAGGDILATLVSIETWAGVPGKSVAFYNNNVGNFKGNHFGGPVGNPSQPGSSMQPCYFLVDRRHSADFYPSFGTLREGMEALVRVLRQPNFPGAVEALRAGNIREFNRALGSPNTNGRLSYADFYESPDAMWGRYARLVRDGSLGRNGVTH